MAVGLQAVRVVARRRDMRTGFLYGGVYVVVAIVITCTSFCMLRRNASYSGINNNLCTPASHYNYYSHKIMTTSYTLCITIIKYYYQEYAIGGGGGGRYEKWYSDFDQRCEG